MDILIVGDSWALGEWSNVKRDFFTKKLIKNRHISHNGITQYFINNGFNVINRSRVGLKNIDSFLILDQSIPHKFERNPITKEVYYPQYFQYPGKNLYFYTQEDANYYFENQIVYEEDTAEEDARQQLPVHTKIPFIDYSDTVILWFQTNPLSEVNLLSENLKSYEEILDKSNNLLDQIYEKLNSLKLYIYCIGGNSKLNLEFMKKYEYLIPLIPSVPEFLYTDYTHPYFWINDEWINDFNNLNIEILHKMVLDKNKKDLLAKNEYAKFFKPDGEHPNRLAHYEIFKYAMENIPKLSQTNNITISNN